MNLVDLLRRYTGKSLQPTGGTHTPAQTSDLLLLKPAQTVRPDKSRSRTNRHGSHFQIANGLQAAEIDEAQVKRESEPEMQRAQACNDKAEPQPATLTWQAQLARWPQERRDRWEERAAIMEYEGDFPRDEAEQQAFELLRDENSHA